ncbi:MAG: AAA family ATPase [Candidatus ainarchaeum sp.]|nr:AAA family ATPase [Candidatus ainarchaeum sp.]
MRIIITGTPGTGKSTLALLLGKKLGCKVVNERDFCRKRKIGRFDRRLQELIVPLGRMQKEMNKLLAREKNIILEGHLLCEARLNSDIVILLRTSPDLLEERLRSRRYPEFKIQDNVLCEGIDYCKKHLLKKHQGKKIFEVKNEKAAGKALGKILKIINEKKKAQERA